MANDAGTPRHAALARVSFNQRRVGATGSPDGKASQASGVQNRTCGKLLFGSLAPLVSVMELAERPQASIRVLFPPEEPAGATERPKMPSAIVFWDPW